MTPSSLPAIRMLYKMWFIFFASWKGLLLWSLQLKNLQIIQYKLTQRGHKNKYCLSTFSLHFLSHNVVVTKQRTYLLHSNNVTLRRPSVSAHCCIWICSSSSSNPCKVWNGKNGLNLTKVKISLNFWIINITVWSIITKPTCRKTNQTPNTACTQQTNAYHNPPSLAANGAFSVAPTPHGFLACAHWQGRRLRTKRKKI